MYDWIGTAWAVLFCHPRAFTPVSTTELGYLARIEGEFERRGVKVIALSVGRPSEHERWARDIEAIGGCRPRFPIVSDDDYVIATLYGCCRLTPRAIAGSQARRKTRTCTARS